MMTHSEDRSELKRLQEELDGLRLELRDVQQTLESHRMVAVKVHESFLPSTPIEVGDHLVLFTDGLPETSGEDDQMLGDQGLIDLALASNCRGAGHMADCILERVRAFGSGAQQDDLTLMVAEFTA